MSSRDYAGARELQAAAEAAIRDPEKRCTETRTHGRTTYVCLRPPHESGQPYTDDWRRNRGDSVNADRHWLVTQGHADRLALEQLARELEAQP